MPTYEYACDACGHEFEEFQSMTAKRLKKCPECGKPKLQRLIGTGAAVIFKGSGFYETDYRSDSYHKDAKADTKSTESNSSSSDSDSKSTSSSDSKTDSSASSGSDSSSSTKTPSKDGAAKKSGTDSGTNSSSKSKGSKKKD